MTPKEKAIELYESMRTPIGESDLHIPSWISDAPQTDYPIEEKQVAKECSIIAVKLLLWELPNVLLDEQEDYKFWEDVKKELESF